MKPYQHPERPAELLSGANPLLLRTLRGISAGVVTASMMCSLAVSAAFATDTSDVELPVDMNEATAADVAPELPSTGGQDVQPVPAETAGEEKPAETASADEDADQAQSEDDEENLEPRRLIGFGTATEPERPIWNRLPTKAEDEKWLNLPEELIFTGDPLPNSPFRAIGSGPFYCQQNYVYSQFVDGTIKEFAPGSTSEGRQIAGAITQREGGINGLAISPDGTFALAIENKERSTGDYWNRIWRYSSGQWKALSVNNTSELYRGRFLVAGAISPIDGKYYFGYYKQDSAKSPLQFVLVRIPVGGGATQVVGNIDIPTKRYSDGWSGDIAFDSMGNLLIVASAGGYAVVASVTPNQLDSSVRPIKAKIQGQGSPAGSSANGVAFRADGSLFLGAQSTVSLNDPLDFSRIENGTYTGGIHVDMGSCDLPPTVVFQKEIEDGRKEPADQFRISLTRTAPPVAQDFSPFEETTTGTSTGIQAENIGPVPIVVGRTYKMDEILIGAGKLEDKYQIKWKCEAPGIRGNVASGEGSAINYTPADNVRSKQVICTMTNTPTGSIAWEKRSDDPNKTLKAGSEWRLTSDVAGFTPINIKDCTAANACAGTNDLDPRAGYLKVDYLKDGTYTLVETKAPAGHKRDATPRPYVVGKAKREHTDTVPNERLKSTIMLRKSVFHEDRTRAESNTFRSMWVLGTKLATGSSAGVNVKVNEQTRDTQETTSLGVVPAAWDIFYNEPTHTANVTLSETLKDGWEAWELVCTNTATNAEIQTFDLSDTPATAGSKATATLTGIAPGTNIACEFKNSRIRGTVTWTKVDEDSPTTKLAGSEWTLTATGAPTITVTDCVKAGQCAGTNDEDPAPGQFKVKGLLYKRYTLRETAAPDGFKVSSATTAVNVTAANRDVALGAITNEHLSSNILLKKTTQFADRKTAATAFRSGWELGAALPTGTPAIVKLTANGAKTDTQNTASNGQVTTPWAITYTSSTDTRSVVVSEPVREGWDALRLICTEDIRNGETLADVDLTKVKAVNGRISATVNGLKPNVGVVCEFINAQTRGTIQWDKVDADSPTTKLPGSEWTLTGGDEDLLIKDCTRAGRCDGTNDDDPTPGRIKVSDLLYNRQYTITETKAPAKYAIPANPSFRVTLTYNDRDRVLDNVTNERISSTLRLVKVTQHADRTNPDNTQRAGWELGATAARGVDMKANGAVTNTQTTQANGTLPNEWKLLYDNATQRHSVTVSEPVRDGWDPQSLVCVDTADNNREIVNQNLSNATAVNGRITHTITGLAPNGNIECTFTNAKSRGTITWYKRETGTTNVLPGSEWNLNANSFGGRNGVNITDCTANGACDGTNDEDPRPGYFKVSDLLYRDYTLTETQPPTGYKIDQATRRIQVNFDNRTHDLGAIDNTALKATLRLVKETRDVDGSVMTTDRNGWALGASLPAGASNSLKANNRVTNTQNTNANGSLAYPWMLGLATVDDRQAVTISEPAKDGWKPVQVVCTRQDGTVLTRADLSSATAERGRFTLTTNGIAPDDDVTCTFVNQREPGTVTWEKVDKDAPTAHLNGSEWTLTAAGKPTITVTDCTEATKCAGTNDTDPRAGYFSVTGLHYASYTLTETKAPAGYKAERATTPVNVTATARTVSLGTIPNVKLKATIRVVNRTTEANAGAALPAFYAGWAVGVELPVGAPATVALTANGKPAATQATGQDGAVAHPWELAFAAEADRQAVTLSEPATEGWQPVALVCTRADGSEFYRADMSGLAAVDGRYSVALPVLAPGDDVTCTFTNEQLAAGTVAWTKVDAGDGTTLLAGAAWELTLPDDSVVAVEDCVSDAACPEASVDQDPAAGKFRVVKLALGDYTLTETQAPAGFVIPDDPNTTFAITSAQRDVNLGAIANEQRAGISIPLTGGASADAFLLTGLGLMGGSAAAAFVLMRRRRNTQGA